MYFYALKVKCRYVKKTSQFNMKVIYHGCGKKHGEENEDSFKTHSNLNECSPMINLIRRYVFAFYVFRNG